MHSYIVFFSAGHKRGLPDQTRGYCEGKSDEEELKGESVPLSEFGSYSSDF